MLMVADSELALDGVNVTTKEVELLVATDDAGAVVTEKSDALVPEKLIVPTESELEPLLLMLNVFASPTPLPELPKSVLFEEEVVVAPLEIELLFPDNEIVGFTNAEQVPLTFPTIQLAVDPVN